MTKTESLFFKLTAPTMAVLICWGLWHNMQLRPRNENHHFAHSNYGAFLAAQHAVYINDFDRAAQFADSIIDADYAPIKGLQYLTQFLSGNMPTDANLLKTEKAIPARLVYDAYLLQSDKWDDLYARHKKDESALTAPLRIWSSVATNHITDVLKFIDKLPTTKSWKNFVRGQIYAQRGDIAKATQYFDEVKTDFININDYLYMMSFYANHGMMDAAESLRNDFTARVGGMYMLEYDDIPDWDMYMGLKNQLAFSLVQNVSHTQVMMYSDLSILLLRFAQIIAPEYNANSDAINYYLGQFFFTNTGDFQSYFDKIGSDSPFYLFGVLRGAERSNNLQKLSRVVKDHPLFVPATNKLLAYNIQNGNKRAALRIVNRALDSGKLTEAGHAFFLKCRAQIYYAFGDMKRAQTDIHDAASILPVDPEILSLQAKIWAAENREIENAYEYAMNLVRRNPSDLLAWDTLGVVIAVREGPDAALDVLQRVGEVAITNSALFEHLGDLYMRTGDFERAQDAYMRAIDLSDDGLSVVPQIQKKVRKLK